MEKFTFSKDYANHVKKWVSNEAWALYVDSRTLSTDSGEKFGAIVHWELSNSFGETYEGISQEDLIKTLKAIPELIGLKYRSNTKKDGTSTIPIPETILVYVEDTIQIYGFLRCCMKKDSIDESYLKLSFNFGPHIEIRSITPFVPSAEAIRDNIKDYTSSLSYCIAFFAQGLFDTTFLPEKHFYITPGRRVRTKMSLSQKKYGDFIAQRSFPRSFFEYEDLRKSYFGGVGLSKIGYFDKPMIMIDIKSSHPYELMTSNHAMYITYYGRYTDKYGNEFSYEDILKYVSSTMSIAHYAITYRNAPGYLRQFADYQHNRTNIYDPEWTVGEYMFTNIDALTFLESFDKEDVYDIHIFETIEYASGKMPKYMCDVIYKAYKEKKDLDCLKGTPSEWSRVISKIFLNSIGGSGAKKISASEYNHEVEKSRSSPIWTFFMASYSRRSVIVLGRELCGWVYSDTDSIICLDTVNNRKKIEDYNSKRMLQTKEICELYEYDYDTINDIGTFEIECEIVKLRINNFKQYGYERSDGKLELKAAGLLRERNTEEAKRKFLDKGDIDFGKIPYKCISDKKVLIHTEYLGDIVSNGSFYVDEVPFSIAGFVTEKLKNLVKDNF